VPDFTLHVRSYKYRQLTTTGFELPSYIFALFVFVRGLVCPMLPMSLDCLFLIALIWFL